MEKARRYIAIEGVTGSGKTSLAQLLAREYGARLILEPVEDNPFLPRFYRDRETYAFPTQISFLLARLRQQKEIQQHDLFHKTLMTDYHFAKDRIFANVTLSDDEVALYNHLHAIVCHAIPTPDLTIFLQASVDILVERIRRRDRPYERGMDQAYLEDLVQAYNRFFFHYDDGPLLVINTNAIDFVGRRSDLLDLMDQTDKTRVGTRYYVPARTGS